VIERASLRDLLAAASVEERLLDALAEYAAMLLEANQKVNLSGAGTPEELAPHILDSLSVAPYVRGALVDIGSGGGLPAIPLAIVTGVPVTMIESTAKKAAFLRSTLTALSLSGTVVTRRAEEAAHDPELREHFKCGTARAVSTAPTVAELLLPFVALGGVAILQRGRMEEAERNALTDASLMLGAEFEGEVALDGERRIVLVRKIASTPNRFPRRVGIPEKRPLCL
jgi:16S rRNA (guanine527-N7)-methyltransferase